MAMAARSGDGALFATLAAMERRIDSVCIRALVGPVDAAVLADVLDAACVCALRLDARGRGLLELLDAPATGETSRVIRDLRSVENSVRQLRTRLVVLRSLTGTGHLRT
jgi:hypothetical protein